MIFEERSTGVKKEEREIAQLIVIMSRFDAERECAICQAKVLGEMRRVLCFVPESVCVCVFVSVCLSTCVSA